MDDSFEWRKLGGHCLLDYLIKYVAAIIIAKFNIDLFVSLVYYKPLTHLYFATYQSILPPVVFIVSKIFQSILIDASRWPLEEGVTALIQLS